MLVAPDRALQPAHLFERVVHRVVTCVADGLFGAPDGHGRLGGNLCSALQCACEQSLGRVEHRVDQTVPECLVRAQAAACVGQLFHYRFGNEFGQALQCAHVGHHADVDLLDAKERICRGVTDAAGGNHVHRTANTTALDGNNDGDTQAFQFGKRGLHVGEHVQHRSTPFGALVVHLDGTGKSFQRHTRAEVFARAADDQHTGRACAVDTRQRLVQLAPELRVHGVHGLGAAQHQVGDMVFFGEGEAVHGCLRDFVWGAKVLRTVKQLRATRCHLGF